MLKNKRMIMNALLLALLVIITVKYFIPFMVMDILGGKAAFGEGAMRSLWRELAAYHIQYKDYPEEFNIQSKSDSMFIKFSYKRINSEQYIANATLRFYTHRDVQYKVDENGVYQLNSDDGSWRMLTVKETVSDNNSRDKI